MNEIGYKSIGVIHSPFKDVQVMLIQPTGAMGIAGTIEIDPECRDGLKDLDCAN